MKTNEFLCYICFKTVDQFSKLLEISNIKIYLKILKSDKFNTVLKQF